MMCFVMRDVRASHRDSVAFTKNDVIGRNYRYDVSEQTMVVEERPSSHEHTQENEHATRY